LLDIPCVKSYLIYYFEFKTYSNFKEGFSKVKIGLKLGRTKCVLKEFINKLKMSDSVAVAS